MGYYSHFKIIGMCKDFTQNALPIFINGAIFFIQIERREYDHF